MSVVIYDGGTRKHLTTDEVLWEVNTSDVISDAAAQTIASWWHSPARPESTALSTSGKVLATTDIYDFASQQDFDTADDFNKMCLRMLNEYIKDRKRTYLSMYPNRCPNCYEYVRGSDIRVGDGKEFTECQHCYSDLYRVWSKSRGWQGWEIVEDED